MISSLRGSKRASRWSIWRQFAGIAYRGVELTGKFWTSWPCRRGFGGRGRQDCVELIKGYAPFVSAIDSTGLSLRVAASVILSLQDDLFAERIETGVSSADSAMALATSPTAELRSTAIVVAPALSEGFRRVWMAG